MQGKLACGKILRRRAERGNWLWVWIVWRQHGLSWHNATRMHEERARAARWCGNGMLRGQRARGVAARGGTAGDVVIAER